MNLTRRTPLPRASKPMRSKGPKMTQARRAAQGMPCLIRLPGCSPGAGNETVVLCHYSLANISGAGLKSPDEIGAYGCASCHLIVDGKAPRPDGYTRNDVRLAFAEGVFRTQMARKGVA